MIRVLLVDDHPVPKRWRSLAPTPTSCGRSAREIEVLALAARGATNAEIGRKLFVSEATVKTHLLRTFGKRGVSGRTAAVTAALERGQLPPRPAS